MSDTPVTDPEEAPEVQAPDTNPEASRDPENEAVVADSFSSEDLEDDLPAPAPAPAPAIQREVDPGFDLMAVEAPSFAVLQEGRRSVYRSIAARDAFCRVLDRLGDSGEEGRRKGLGLWMVGEYDRAAKQLDAYADDDVAAFTLAKSYMASGRPGDALPVFERLSKAYPDEPRPRGGALEAAFDSAWAGGGTDEAEQAACDALEKGIESAPDGFRDSAEHHYLNGRLAEGRRDWESAIEHYVNAANLDSSLREATFRGAHLAERCGLDELAIELYERLVKSGTIEANALLNLGVLYEDVGRDQDAAACYETVTRNIPTHDRARLYLNDARSAIDMYYDEDLERKEDRLNQILRIPITDFELSVRARNCLNKMNITTLGDLVCRTEQELLSYKNFGETSLNEIKEILHSKGLRLGMPREEAVASVESAARRQQGGNESSDVMNRPITDLQLSIRARRTVEALGCLTVGDICKHSTDELLGMPNFGVTSLQELRNKLGELGLKLRGE